jgi:hypothetical protein
MFADSLLDLGKDHHSHRGWTTLASLALEALGIGSVLLRPQLHRKGLPQFQLRGIMAVPAPPSPPRPGPHRLPTLDRRKVVTSRILAMGRFFERSPTRSRLNLRPPGRCLPRDGSQLVGPLEPGSAANVEAIHPSATHIAHDGRQPDLQGAAILSGAGQGDPSARAGGPRSQHQPDRDHRKPARRLGTPAAGEGCNRGGRALARSPLAAEWRSRGGRNRGHREFCPRRRITKSHANRTLADGTEDQPNPGPNRP